MKSRLFIGIDFPLRLKKRLQRLFSTKIDAEAYTHVNWEEAENLHVTIAFLGETAVPVSEIARHLEKKLISTKTFLLQLGEAGVFIQPKKTIILVDVVKTEPLMSLYYMVINEMEKLGFTRDRRQYHPHITIGKTTQPNFRLKNSFSPMKKPLLVSQVTIFETAASSGIKKYLPRETIQLVSSAMV